MHGVNIHLLFLDLDFKRWLFLETRKLGQEKHSARTQDILHELSIESDFKMPLNGSLLFRVSNLENSLIEQQAWCKN